MLAAIKTWLERINQPHVQDLLRPELRQDQLDLGTVRPLEVTPRAELQSTPVELPTAPRLVIGEPRPELRQDQLDLATVRLSEITPRARPV